MTRRAIWIALGSTLLCLSSMAQQLKPHTEFRVKLTGPLSTQANRKGDKLAAQVMSPKAFAGTTLEGEITDCNGKGLLHRKAVLRFTFRTLHTKRGAIAIASDVKQVSGSKGGMNTDDSGAGIEHSSELLALANTALGGKVDDASRRVGGNPAGAAVSAIVVQMSSNEKNISFAPGSVFILDISPIGNGR